MRNALARFPLALIASGVVSLGILQVVWAPMWRSAFVVETSTVLAILVSIGQVVIAIFSIVGAILAGALGDLRALSESYTEEQGNVGVAMDIEALDRLRQRLVDNLPDHPHSRVVARVAELVRRVEEIRTEPDKALDEYLLLSEDITRFELAKDNEIRKARATLAPLRDLLDDAWRRHKKCRAAEVCRRLDAWVRTLSTYGGVGAMLAFLCYSPVPLPNAMNLSQGNASIPVGVAFLGISYILFLALSICYLCVRGLLEERKWIEGAKNSSRDLGRKYRDARRKLLC